jgi:hypothetical protein
METIAACCESITLAPEGTVPDMTVSNSLCWTFCHHNPLWTLDDPTVISTQARGGALPLVSQQKTYDWCKHSLSFVCWSMIGANNLTAPPFWLYKRTLWTPCESARRNPVVPPWCYNIRLNKILFQVVIACLLLIFIILWRALSWWHKERKVAAAAEVAEQPEQKWRQ